MFMQDISRFNATQISSALPVSTGILAGTLIETSKGWMPAEDLRTGDQVQTHDGGLRTVRALNRAWLYPADTAGLICLPGGSFDNCDDLFLLPSQEILFDLDDADSIPDAIHALIPAKALLGFGGTFKLTPLNPIEVLAPLFDEEEVLWAASGVRLHCRGIANEGDYFTRLTPGQTRALLSRRYGLGLAA